MLHRVERLDLTQSQQKDDLLGRKNREVSFYFINRPPTYQMVERFLF